MWLGPLALREWASRNPKDLVECECSTKFLKPKRSLVSSFRVHEVCGFADVQDGSAPTQRKAASRPLCELETGVLKKQELSSPGIDRDSLVCFGKGNSIVFMFLCSRRGVHQDRVRGSQLVERSSRLVMKRFCLVPHHAYSMPCGCHKSSLSPQEVSVACSPRFRLLMSHTAVLVGFGLVAAQTAGLPADSCILKPNVD